MKQIAMILSGAGFKDGSEITESVSALIALDKYQSKVTMFAPDINFISKNHKDDISSNETRNTLVESARIARGKIFNLTDLDSKNFDGIIFPGGYGVATQLSNWAQRGALCEVDNAIFQIIEEFYRDSKPICAICIAPALIARVLGKHKVSLTIGNDQNTISEILKTGARHEECDVNDFISDREHKIISTPAYMYDASPFQIFNGIEKAVKEFVEMA